MVDLFEWAAGQEQAKASSKPAPKPAGTGKAAAPGRRRKVPVKPAAAPPPASNVIAFSPAVTSAPRAEAEGEVCFLPITRRKDVITKFARRLAEYGITKQTTFYVRSDLERMAERRIRKGIPVEVAYTDCDTLERAIHVAARLMRSTGGSAA